MKKNTKTKNPVFPKSLLADWCSRLYPEPSFYKAAGSQICYYKHDLKTVANFSRSKRTSQGQIGVLELELPLGLTLMLRPWR